MNTFRPSFGGGGGGGRGRRDFRPPQQKEKFRINEQIIARAVLVISETGEQLGQMATRDAIMRAQSVELDLVEVSPNAVPPVCRIMDYGKFKYKQQKKDHEARKHRSENTVKELRIRYRTDIGDLETKLNQTKGFLADGDKVKIVVVFKGREAMFRDIGREKLDWFEERLKDVAIIDERSPISGNQIYLLFAPGTGKK